MKRKIILSLVLLVANIYLTPVNAVDKCLTIFPDSDWSFGQPEAVTKFLSENSKDYTGGLRFNEWEYAPGKWWKYEGGNSAQNLNPTIAARFRNLNTIEAIPFSLGAKTGDKIRSTYEYAGRNCVARTVVVSPSKIYSEANLLSYENDYEVFVKAISKDFNYERGIRALVPKNIDIKIEKSQGKPIVANQTLVDSVFQFTEELPEELATNTFFYFPDGCFSILKSNEFQLNWWNAGARTFTKLGNCSAQMYYVSEVPQIRKLLLYKYGSVSFTVTGNTVPKSSKKEITIICIKGKTVQKIAAINPKCPSGFIKK